MEFLDEIHAIIQSHDESNIDSCKILRVDLKERSTKLHEIATQEYESSSDISYLMYLIQNIGNFNSGYATLFLLAIQSKHVNLQFRRNYISLCVKVINFIHSSKSEFDFDDLATVVEALTSIACELGNSRLVISTLKNAIDLTCPNQQYLTPYHTFFLQVCITSQNYSTALNEMKKWTIWDIDNKHSKLSILQYLTFYYYCGICYISSNHFEEAISNFNMAITFPGDILSSVVLESFKKAKLCSLIAYGNDYSFPSHCSTGIKRELDALKIYDSIINAFNNCNKDLLVSAVEKASLELNKDNNYGLATQLVDALEKHQALRLMKIYETISIQKMEKVLKVSAERVVCIVSTLITNRDVAAKIDLQSNMIYIRDEDNQFVDGQYFTTKAISILEKNTIEANLWKEKLQSMQRSILLSEEFNKKILFDAAKKSGHSILDPSEANEMDQEEY